MIDMNFWRQNDTMNNIMMYGNYNKKLYYILLNEPTIKDFVF